MAFSRDRLKSLGGGGAVPKLWMYKTDDAVGTVDTADYFAEAADLLRVGDVIIRQTVTNIDASNEAFSTGGFHVVNARSLTAGVGSVDVANVLAFTTTDSD